MNEIIIDSFAGGGGASLGIEMALGRSPDVAINHDDDALAMHAVNHPSTEHLSSNIWRVDPDSVRPGSPIGLLWASPDCKHHSKAKGGKPLSRNIRDLAWIVVLWARRRLPRLICLENVEEFQQWGPLGADDRPLADRHGETFKQFVRELRALGYAVEWRELRACDYGAPTIRKRLFLIARRDGRPIVWPMPTHGPRGSAGVAAGILQPYRVAADIIDWSLPCPSIFLTREQGRAAGCNRPLSENTMARIAKGLRRYVLDAAAPFIIPVTHGGDSRVHSVAEPLRTVTCAPRGEHALVAAFLAQHNTGAVGRQADAPLSTVTQRGTQQAIVSAGLVNLKGSARRGRPIDAPVPTVTSQGAHVAEIRAFLIKYYGSDQDPRLEEPLHTITSRHRFGIVTVHGEPYQIVDIGMRMLRARELFRGQGFPDSYCIDRRPDGSALTATASIRMCGNSVAPPVARAIVAANYSEAEAAGVFEPAALPLFVDAAE